MLFINRCTNMVLLVFISGLVYPISSWPCIRTSSAGSHIRRPGYLQNRIHPTTSAKPIHTSSGHRPYRQGRLPCQLSHATNISLVQYNPKHACSGAENTHSVDTHWKSLLLFADTYETNGKCKSYNEDSQTSLEDPGCGSGEW